MKKLILLLTIAFIMGFAAPSYALDVAFSDNIKRDCNRENDEDPILGCYFGLSGEIKIKLNDYLAMISTIIHELGHYYTLVDSAKFDGYTNYSLKSNLKTDTPEENIAEWFVSWTYQQGMGIVVSKPYVRYYGEFDVYEYNTGQIVSYEYAAKNNIWNNIQDMPFTRHLAAPSQNGYFSSITKLNR